MSCVSLLFELLKLSKVTDKNPFNTITRHDGENLFIANEVCLFMGYDESEIGTEISEHVDHKRTRTMGDYSDTNCEKLKELLLPHVEITEDIEKIVMLTESGLYQLLLRSRLENPVVSEIQTIFYNRILPSIGKRAP